MERNPNQHQGQGSSPSSISPQNEAPYFKSPGKKETISAGFNKILLDGLLVAILGGGGLIACKMLSSGS